MTSKKHLQNTNNILLNGKAKVFSTNNKYKRTQKRKNKHRNCKNRLTIWMRSMKKILLR